MKNKPKTLTPKLRFPEFKDGPGWTTAQLDELAAFVNDRIDTDRLSLSTYVSTENILPDFGGITTAAKLPSTNGATKYVVDDILVSNIRPYLKKVWLSDREGGASNDVVVIRPKDAALKQYLPLALKSDSFIEYVTKGAKGVKMPRGDIALMTKYPVSYPSPAEQRKIAACLTSLDEWVAAEERKLEALRAHKNGLMQQLFPREGETRPCLRLLAFRKAPTWEPKALGQVLLETPRPIEMIDNADYSLVTVKRRYGGVVFRGYMKGKAILVKSQFLVYTDDFLISKRQIVHNACGLVPAALEGSVVSNEYCVMTPKPGYDIHFLNYFVQQPCVSRSFLQASVGIVIEKMLFKLESWLKMEFLFPSLEEQQQIAACLSSLDALIAAQSRKLNSLRTHKRGLMQQLFPSPE